MAGGGSAENGNVNIIPLMDVIFIFIFFLLMSVQFLEFFSITVSNPISKSSDATPPDKKDEKEKKQFKLLLSKTKIELSEGLEEKVIETVDYSDSGIEKLKRILLEKKKQYPDETAMIVKPYKDVDFNHIVLAVDSAQQKLNPTKKNDNEKVFKSIAFEARGEE
jgi:biopolymer transport protein ExbD